MEINFADTGADYCYNLSWSGYSDWWLPSRDEMADMYVQKIPVMFTSSVYFSSSEYNIYWSFYLSFDNGALSITWKNGSYIHAGAIRGY